MFTRDSTVYFMFDFSLFHWIPGLLAGKKVKISKKYSLLSLCVWMDSGGVWERKVGIGLAHAGPNRSVKRAVATLFLSFCWINNICCSVG